MMDNLVKKGERVPKYQVLEYITSTGSQYITTDYIPLANDIFEIKANLNSNVIVDSYQTLFGTRNSDMTKNYGLFARHNGAFKYCYCRTNNETDLSNGKYNTDVVITTNGRNISWTANGSTYTGTSGGSSSPVDCITPLAIFAYYVNNKTTWPTAATLYYFKVKRNDEIIHNFIPVRVFNHKESGLYDTITKTFYPSDTKTLFTNGNDTGELIY